MSRDGSDWDYINEHLGGHDSDGIPRFLRDSELTGNSSLFSDIDSVSAMLILENLINRMKLWFDVEIPIGEPPELFSVTEIEIEALKERHWRLTVAKDNLQKSELDKNIESSLLIMESFMARLETSNWKRVNHLSKDARDSGETYHLIITQIHPTQIEFDAIELLYKRLSIPDPYLFEQTEQEQHSPSSKDEDILF